MYFVCRNRRSIKFSSFKSVSAMLTYPLVFHPVQGILQQCTKGIYADQGHGLGSCIYAFCTHYFLKKKLYRLNYYIKDRSAIS